MAPKLRPGSQFKLERCRGRRMRRFRRSNIARDRPERSQETFRLTRENACLRECIRSETASAKIGLDIDTQLWTRPETGRVCSQ